MMNGAMRTGAKPIGAMALCVGWLLPWAGIVFAQAPDVTDEAVDAGWAADAATRVEPAVVITTPARVPVIGKPARTRPSVVDAGVAPVVVAAPVIVADAGVAAVVEALPQVMVTLNDTPVFALRLGRAGRTVEERASAARKALEAVVTKTRVDDIRSHATQDGVVVIFADDAPIVQLATADATAAGDASLDVHAAAVLASIKTAVEREQERRAIANTAFSVSLSVLLGLITLYMLRRFHEMADRGAAYLSSPQRSLSAVRMSSIEVIAPGTLRSMLLVALSVARWIGSFGVVYAWVIVVLSMFEVTRGYTEQLTGYVVNPLAALMGRLAASLPTFVVAFVAALAVVLLVRFVGLFFASVARGEASLSWVPPDLAMAFSVPLRVAIVVSALVFAAPIVTGDADGSLSMLGRLLLITLALASVPLLANAIIGLLLLWGRRVRVGERAELGGVRGRVLGIDLWSVRMEDLGGAEVHVPHWLVLLRPMRVFSLSRRVSVDVTISEEVASAGVLKCLQGAPADGFDQVSAMLLRIGDGVVVYRLSARSSVPQAENTLLFRVREAAMRDAITILRASVLEDVS